jgi:hypothetical protein
MPGTLKVMKRFRRSSVPTRDSIARAWGPNRRWRRRETTKASPKSRRWPRMPQRGLVGRRQDGQDVAAQGAQDVDDGVLNVPVHLLDDRAEEPEGIHVEEDVERPRWRNAAVMRRHHSPSATAGPTRRPRSRRPLPPLIGDPVLERGAVHRTITLAATIPHVTSAV